MRWMLISLGLVAVLGIAAFLWTEWQMAGIETPRYTVDSTDGDFEIRTYAPMLTATVTVTGDRREAASKGFSLLAEFIFGGNRTNAKIDMTAPVVQQPVEGEKIAMTAPVEQTAVGEGTWQVSFIMPQQYALETLPVPNNGAITLEERPGERVIAVKFSGVASASDLARESERLMAFMTERGLSPAGDPRFAFYDPPWRVPFLRRNEVLIPL